MADLFLFETAEGYGVVIDMDTLLACWEGKTPNCTVFILMGANDPLEVKGNFYEFVADYFDVYDCRPKQELLKKKPRRKQQQQGSPSIKAEVMSSKMAEE